MIQPQLQAQDQEAKNSWIRVYIRVRPLLRNEIGQDQILSVDKDNKTVILEGSSVYTFRQTFDRAFGDQSLQKDIFEEFKQTSHLIVQGFNFSVLAYGQTGSGKTYTMFGNDWEYMLSQIPRGMPKIDSPVKIQHQSTFLEDIATDENNAGMIPRSIYHIFCVVEQVSKQRGQPYFVYCSFLQIYNEKIYDLLVDADIPTPLTLHENKLDGVFVEGLSEYAVNHYYDCLTLMKRGEKNRFIRQTSMNAKSSRSHTIFQVLIESSKADETGSFKKSKVNLCDLAGSEKMKRTETLKKQHFTELVNINQSLTTLGKVIQNLSQNATRKKILPIPYRESKLTRLLQDSLGGNTQTFFIANVSSSMQLIYLLFDISNNLDETYSTLKFAERAKNITLQIAPNKVDALNSDLLNKLTREINYLKSLLNMKRAGVNANDFHYKMMKLQEENDRLRTNTVSINEVEKLVQENRSMKIEIQKLHQTLTLGSSIDGLSQGEMKQHTDIYQQLKTDPNTYLPTINVPRDLTESRSMSKLQSMRNSYQTFEISPSSTKHKPNSSRFNIPQSSTFKNGGMMVINNFNSIPKTEVAVRVKLRNNQYSNKKGFVEQSEKQHNRETQLKSERQRVLERLQNLEQMKQENQINFQKELHQIEFRSKSYNQDKMYKLKQYEDKEFKRLHDFDNKLKIIEGKLALS